MARLIHRKKTMLDERQSSMFTRDRMKRASTHFICKSYTAGLSRREESSHSSQRIVHTILEDETVQIGYIQARGHSNPDAFLILHRARYVGFKPEQPRVGETVAEVG